MKKFRLSDTRDHISEEGLSNGSRLAPAKSIFVVVRGMILAKDLPVALAEVPMAFNQDMKALVARPVVDPEYLLYALAARKDALATAISTSAHGTRRMETASLERLLVPLPPKDEQHRIATVMGKLDAAADIQGRLLAALRELKAATMAKLFREGLRGKPLKQTEIGEIPQDWEVIPLQSVFREPLRNGHSAVASPDGSGVRTLTLTAVTKRDFSEANSKITNAQPSRVEALWLHDGDLLIERANTLEMVGLAALYRGPDNFAIFPDLLIRVRVQVDRLLPEVLEHWLLSPWCRAYFRRHCRGAATNMPKIDHRTVDSVLIPIPPIDEQRELTVAFRCLDSQIALESRRAQHLASIFSSTLHLLMTGQARVRPEVVNIDQQQTAPDARAPRASRAPGAQIVQSIVDLIAQAVAPERIFLFGEAVPESPGTKSGVGLLVVMSFEGRSLAKAIEIERDVRPQIPVEILVRRPDDVSRALQGGDPLIRGIVERGRLMHASAVARAPEPPSPRSVRRGAVSEEVLSEIVQRIVEVAAPKEIILFGSAARGEMGPDSDIDLLVVTETDQPRETAQRIRQRLIGVPPGVPKDVIVVTPEHLERHKDTIGFIFRPALREGRVLHVA